MNGPDVEVCPECSGEQIGVEVRGVYDGVLFWECRGGHRWHRFPEGNPYRARAERLWERWDNQGPYADHVPELEEQA